MVKRDNQDMPSVDRTDVHEGHALAVSVDDADLGSTSDDVAEHAIAHRSIVASDWSG